MPIKDLVVVTMNKNFWGTHGHDGHSKLLTKELSKKLQQKTVGETCVIMYPEGYIVAWSVDIITDEMKPKILICENLLLLENNDYYSLLSKLKYILDNQRDIKEESYTLIIVAYYPRCEPLPGSVNLKEYGWEYSQKPNNPDEVTDENMTWVEYVFVTDC